MLFHVIPHELTNYLSCGLVLRATSREKRFTQIALHPYAKTYIFHADSVSNGYTFV